MKAIAYLGIDVHKNTFNLCALDGATGEILGETRCASDVKLVKKFLEKIARDHKGDIQFKVGYEAGCLGYSLHDLLEKQGIDCDILAPTTMYSSSKNKVMKNDRLDAKMIALNLINNTYKPVYVPDKEDICVYCHVLRSQLRSKHFYYAMDWFMTGDLVGRLPTEMVKGFEANRFIERNSGRIPITV